MRRRRSYVVARDLPQQLSTPMAIRVGRLTESPEIVHRANRLEGLVNLRAAVAPVDPSEE
jgi:hypothetical protein